MAPQCSVCVAPNFAEVEAIGLLALHGEISWREAGRRANWPRFQSLQNHMEKHYTAALERDAVDELDALILTAVTDLAANMRIAPVEVKPLYAAAIVNLRGLKGTKPSQAHLIQSLKTIQEMTGMRNEQRMMMVFAEAMFREVKTAERPALAVVSELVLEEVNP